MHEMLPHLIQTDFPRVRRTTLTTLQANIGYRCNQSCVHCHVAASPQRTEEMSWETMEMLLQFMQKSGAKTLDLTGGAPEMNPHFKRLVSAATSQGIHVMDRCNLTILTEPGYEDMAAFLADHKVEIVASLPCYLEDNVNAQRGKGVFTASLEGLQQLNELGYGIPGSDLVINLVYNPQGPVLPPPQASLEIAYKQELESRYGIHFNQLFTLANMPIQRFGSMLLSKGLFKPYMELLRSSFNENTLEGLMCRSLISVDWQGYVYDCDFNQQLNMPLGDQSDAIHLSQLFDQTMQDQPIKIGDHCYGCTAGQGSSCGGALS